MNTIFVVILYKVIIFKLLLSQSHTINNHVVDNSVNHVTFVGETVVIPCRITDSHKNECSSSSVRWNHTPTWDTRSRTIYHPGMISGSLKQRYVVPETHQQTNLAIFNVTFTDSGQYSCKDSCDGSGIANLTVLGNDLRGYETTDGIVSTGANCSSGPALINMTCIISFAGNIPPVIQWRREGSNLEDSYQTLIKIETSLNNASTERISKAISTLLMTKNTTMNGSRYTCSISHPSFSSSKMQSRYNLSWTFEQLKILPFIRRRPTRNLSKQLIITENLMSELTSSVPTSSPSENGLFWLTIGLPGAALLVIIVLLVVIIVMCACFRSRSGSQPTENIYQEPNMNSSFNYSARGFRNDVPPLPVRDVAVSLSGDQAGNWTSADKLHEDQRQTLSEPGVYLRMPIGPHHTTQDRYNDLGYIYLPEDSNRSPIPSCLEGSHDPDYEKIRDLSGPSRAGLGPTLPYRPLIRNGDQILTSGNQYDGDHSQLYLNESNPSSPESPEKNGDSKFVVPSTASLTRIPLDIGNQSEVSGVAKIHNSLFVLCRKFPKIFQFCSRSPFERLGVINLPNINDPNDMAACTKNSCLYIICTNGEIYRVNVPDNVLERMDLIIEKPPYTISVSSDGTLVIPHDRVKPERYIQKDVIAPDLLILTVKKNTTTFSKRITSLPGEWKDQSGITHRVKLHHAVQLESGNFLLSYGESCTYVCEVSSGGTFIERSNQAKFTGVSGHLIKVQQSQSKKYCVYLTRNEGIVKLNRRLNEISIEDEFREDKLRKKEPTRLCSFDQNSFLVGTKHGGAYILSDSQSIGTLVSVSKNTRTESALIKLDNGGQSEISGVAHLRNNLYVLCRKSPKVFWYNSKSPFELRGEIQLPNVKDPNDMAACIKNSCLYIICTNGEIYRVKVPVNTVILLNLMIEKPPYTLSVSSDGTIVIPHDRVKPERYIQKDVVAPDLLMLTVDEKLKLTKRITSLPGEWKDYLGVPHRVKLHHAVQLAAGNFLVSYGETCAYVCEVSSGGAFLETSIHAKFEGSCGHLITVKLLQDNDYVVYLTRNEGIIKLNSKLEVIAIEEEFNEHRKKKKVPTATLR